MLSISDHSIRNGAKEAIFCFGLTQLSIIRLQYLIAIPLNVQSTARCGVRKISLDYQNLIRIKVIGKGCLTSTVFVAEVGESPDVP